MLVQSFASILESAQADHNWRGASGYIADIDSLSSDAAMQALEKSHRGCFAFLAFDGKLDHAVAEYVAGGSLAADSGPDVLVLFTIQDAVATPKPLSLGMMNGVALIDGGKHPVYDYVRQLVPAITNPPLPSVVLFDRFTDGASPVIVGLGDAATAAAVRMRLQTVFAAAATHAFVRDGSFADRLAADFASKDITYVRGGGTSMREWLASLLLWAKRNASTVVSILKLFS